MSVEGKRDGEGVNFTGLTCFTHHAQVAFIHFEPQLLRFSGLQVNA